MATIDEISIKISADPREALANLRKLQNEATKTERVFRNIRDFEINADVTNAIRAIQRVRKELENLTDKDINLKVDAANVLASLQALKSQIGSIDANPIDLRLNTRSALADISALERRLSNIRNRAIPLDLDVTDALNGIDRVSNGLEALDNINIDANVTDALNSINSIQRRLDDVISSARTDLTITARANVQGALSALQRLQQARLAAAGSAGITGAAGAGVEGGDGASLIDIAQLAAIQNIGKASAQSLDPLNQRLRAIKDELAVIDQEANLASESMKQLADDGGFAASYLDELSVRAAELTEEQANLRKEIVASAQTIKGQSNSYAQTAAASQKAIQAAAEEVVAIRAKIEATKAYITQLENQRSSELRYPVAAQDTQEINRLTNQIRDVSASAKLLERDLAGAEQSYKKLAASGGEVVASAKSIGNAIKNNIIGGFNKLRTEGPSALRGIKIDVDSLKASFVSLGQRIKDAGSYLQKSFTANAPDLLMIDDELQSIGRSTKGLSAIGDVAAKQSSGIGELFDQLTDLDALFKGFVIVEALSPLIEFGKQSFVTAAQIQQLEDVIKSTSSSYQQYGLAIGLARTNQQRFGGTIEENLQAIQQAVAISNRYGVALTDINKVAQLLAVVNPLEGISGAQFALGELFAGDISSIVERFNLPRSAVNELKEANLSAAETIVEVTRLLAEQGVTAQTLEASLQGPIGSINRLNAAWANLGENFGIFLAESTPLIAVLDLTSNALAMVSDTFATTNGIILDGSSSYDEYARSIENANGILQLFKQVMDSIPVFGPIFSFLDISTGPLTELQYEYARSLIEQGVASEEAARQAGALTDETIKQGPAAIAAAEAARAQASALREQARDAKAAAKAEEELLRAQAQAAISSAKQKRYYAEQREESAAYREAVAADTERIRELRAGDNGTEAQIDFERRLAAAVKTYGAQRATYISALSKDYNLLEDSIWGAVFAELRLSNAPPPTSTFSVPGFVQTRPKIKPIIPEPPKGGGRSGGISDAEREAQELERIRQSILEEERRFAIERLRIEQDYYRKSAAARKVFSDTQFADRAGFYDQLGQIEDQGLRRSLSAQYEDAQIEAAKLRDTLGADVADQFLQTAAANILAQGQRQVAITTAQTEGRTGDAEYLQGVDRLYRDAEARKLERIKEGEGSIEQERATAVDELSINYAESLREFISGEDAKAKAVEFVNEALRRQASLLSPAANEELKLNVSITNPQLDELRRSIDALAVRLPAGV